MKVRRPARAGSFYEASEKGLRAQIEGCFLHTLGPGKIPRISEGNGRKLIALVCPHAGYMYSGPIAAHSYSRLAQHGEVDSVVILGPNHTGIGSAVSMYDEGVWQTPLGEAQIDSELADEIGKNSEIIDSEEGAHRYEHSIEVQIPFLQYLYGKDLKFVPICMMLQDLSTSIEVGEAVARAVKGRNVIILASTDMSHYEPQQVTTAKDREAIDTILALDESSLQKVVEKKFITMCGYGPVTAALRSAKLLGAKNAAQLSYGTSGDASGDYAAVVGYLSAEIT